jgi:hypothetical protein
MYRTLKLCSGSGGYEALPDPPRPLDLALAQATLESAGIAVVDARVMLIAAMDPDVTLSRNGRILIKTRDAAAAGRAFDRLRTLLELPAAK